MWDRYFYERTRRDAVERVSDKITMRPNAGPICRADHDNCYASRLEVLLVAQVLIGRDEHFVAIGFGSRKQCAILKLVPAAFESGLHIMR